MIWTTLQAVQRSTMLDFTRELADKHHFVRTPSGNWTRTLGAPGLLPEQSDVRLVNVRGRVWHMVHA